MPRTLSESTERLIAALERKHAERVEALEGEGELIKVSDITRGLGFLYEKIRNTLDYKEEALWAKNATLRALKRKLGAFVAGEKIGRQIVEDLIRGRYLENNSVPESGADYVDTILAKYRLLLEKISEQYPKEADQLEAWLLETAASEIEEALRKSEEDRLYVTFMYEAMRSRTKIAHELDAGDVNVQIYLASHRSLLQVDPGIETYLVFRLIEPMWGQANDEVISRVAERIRSTQERIQSILAHPIRKTLDNAFKRRAIIIHLLRDVISSAPERAREILESPEELETTLKEFYEKRYRDNRVRLQRTAVRAVIFIFITKMLVALLAEVPYEILKTGHFNLVALGVTTFLPPLVLLGAALAIRMPGEEKNFVRLVMDFEMLIAAEEPSTPLDVFKPDRRRSFATILGLTVLYIANFTLTFSIVAWFLKALHFNWLSSSLFIFFLSLVAFFALRLRKTANELAALEERESYGRAIIDFLTFPIVELGRLLAKGLSSINAVSFIFDFFIEAPFHAFVAILEEWITFMKERKKSM